MKKYISIMFVLLPVIGFCQYTPQFSQLIKTLEFVNPGYNASRIDPSVSLLYRSQFSGFDGAPKLMAANFNIPVNKWHMGFGMNSIGETHGLMTQINAALNANIDVKLSPSSYLAFGMNGGIDSKYIDMARAVNEGEFITAEEINSNSFYTAAGLNLFTQNLHLGAALHYSQLKGTHYRSNEFFSIYLNGSYLFDLSKDVALKPAMLYRYYAGESSFDLGCFVLYKDMAWAGLAYRLNQAIIIFGDVKLTKYLRLGYSFDMEFMKPGQYIYGNHELSLELTLPHHKEAFERFAQ